MFNNLHQHSDYSVMDGMCKCKDMVIKAKELGYKGLALTDHGTVSGLLDFYGECNKQGIKPVLGAEFYIIPVIGLEDRTNIAHIILLAKNNVGYKNLLKLDTIAHQNLYYKPRITINDLERLSEGLICTSACMGGLMLRNDREEWVIRLKQIFGDDFYLEMDSNTMPEQAEFNLEIVRLSEKYNVKTIAAIDSHYLNKEDAETHRLWKNLKKDSEYYTTDDYYIMSEEEIRNNMSYLPQDVLDSAIANTEEIVDKCNVIIEFGGEHYPVVDVANSFEYIYNICVKRMDELGLSDLEAYKSRLNYELEIMTKARYLDYFVLIHTVTSWTDKQKILRTPGRGSCVASLVAYLMNITMLDPIKFDLIFERFLHLERVTPCDK